MDQYRTMENKKFPDRTKQPLVKRAAKALIPRVSILNQFSEKLSFRGDLLNLLQMADLQPRTARRTRRTNLLLSMVRVRISRPQCLWLVLFIIPNASLLCGFLRSKNDLLFYMMMHKSKGHTTIQTFIE